MSKKALLKKAARGSIKAKGKKGKGADECKLGANIRDVALRKVTEDSLFIYGSYVVMNRAIPELRDGLKPVHRSALWAMNGLGLTPVSKHKKAARVVGDTIGKYHPHGDMSVYDAMVNLASYNPSLIDGKGNWGTPDDAAAAYRYTECRTSHYTNLFLMDKGYMNAVTLIDNFDGTEKIPMNLPALLPNMLLMGNPTAPAYGTRAGNPPMCMDGMVKILLNAFRKGKPVTLKQCLKYLYVDYAFDCVNMYSDADWKSYLETGRGSLAYCPRIEAVWDHDIKDCQKQILITSYSPGFRDNSVSKKTMKIADMDGVSNVIPACGDNDPYGRAGKFGALYIVEPSRGISEDDFFALAEKIEKELTEKESYSPGAVIKNVKSTKFRTPNIPELINLWINYRIKLEVRYIDYLLGELERKLDHQELLLYAVDNKDKLLKVLPKVLDSKDPDKALAKALKIDIEFAKRVLSLQIRRMAKLERPPIAALIKEYKAEIKSLGKDRKDPKPRIADHLKATYSKYCKLTGKIKSKN